MHDLVGARVGIPGVVAAQFVGDGMPAALVPVPFVDQQLTVAPREAVAPEEVHAVHVGRRATARRMVHEVPERRGAGLEERVVQGVTVDEAAGVGEIHDVRVVSGGPRRPSSGVRVAAGSRGQNQEHGAALGRRAQRR